MVYYTSPKFLKFQSLNQKKQICNHLEIANRVGQKNRNWYELQFF